MLLMLKYNKGSIADPSVVLWLSRFLRNARVLLRVLRHWAKICTRIWLWRRGFRKVVLQGSGPNNLCCAVWTERSALRIHGWPVHEIDQIRDQDTERWVCERTLSALVSTRSLWSDLMRASERSVCLKNADESKVVLSMLVPIEAHNCLISCCNSLTWFSRCCCS